MVRPITDTELLKKKYPCGVGGCEEVVSYANLMIGSTVCGGIAVKLMLMFHNLGFNLKELHEDAIRKIALPPLTSVCKIFPR